MRQIFISRGEILSCQHLEAKGAIYQIVDFFGNSHKVTKTRASKEHDLAIFCIDPNGLTPEINGVPFGSVSIGEDVYAVGTPVTSMLQCTLTKGIVNGIRDDSFGGMKMLQHDAAINMGNSGGPLFNSEGDLVGINRALICPCVPQWCGIGLAVHYEVIRDFYQRYEVCEFDPISLEDIYEMLVRLP